MLHQSRHHRHHQQYEHNTAVPCTITHYRRLTLVTTVVICTQNRHATGPEDATLDFTKFTTSFLWRSLWWRGILSLAFGSIPVHEDSWAIFVFVYFSTT